MASPMMLCRERPKNLTPGYPGTLPILGSRQEVSMAAQQVKEDQ